MLRRYKRGIALVLLLTFGQDIFLPSTLWALTGGPSQPEVNSFEPVGTNQMVDLTTGDFTYNIPLMVVPGPNGGYPINLAYHAGPGMDQEASWVGLGWNINPGAITRNLRGVPDDFSGDEIVKKTNLKTDVTVGASLHMDQITLEEEEKYSYKPQEGSIQSNSLKVYFNNYRGIGYQFTPTPLRFEKEVSCGEMIDYSLLGNLGLSFDSNTGLGVQGSVGLERTNSDLSKRWNKLGFNVGTSFSTREGVQGLRFGYYKEKGLLNFHRSNRKRGGQNISFANSTYIGGANNTMFGAHALVGITLDTKDVFYKYSKNKTIRGEITTNSLINRERSFKAYGGFYLEDQESLKDADPSYGGRYDRVMDFNVYNKTQINKRSVNMGLPIMTTDIYSVTGQGIGGVFRAHRNDIGRFYDEGNTSNTVSVTYAEEFGFGYSTSPPMILTRAGKDAVVGGHHSYSGKWTEGTLQLDDVELGFQKEEERLVYRKASSSRPKYEPFYLKMAGEMVAYEIDEWHNVNSDDPIAFGIVMDLWESGEGFDGSPTRKPKVRNNATNIGGKIVQRDRDKARVKRVQNIEYYQKKDFTKRENPDNRPAHLFEPNEVPGLDNGTLINYNDIGGTEYNKDHHIHGYSIVRPDGSRYSYGLPAYNTYQLENVFANREGVVTDGISKYADKETVTYNELDADITNDEGVDHYYSSTEIPSYVHAHLITEITSADYVDLTGNGVSEDDFGFYAKFNYSKVSNYKWRDPFSDAEYIKGHYSNEFDDKASFTYGEKDLYYVHSIETKTHIAVFEMGERADGIGVNDVHQTSEEALTGQKQRYLKKIQLYSKNDILAVDSDVILEEGLAAVVPLKTVHFIYNYDLCVGVPNNDMSIGEDDADHILNNNGGKLTLKKLFITYNGNEKGRLSPYEFSYDSNPGYSRINMDRWGNFQRPKTGDGPSDDDAYENLINPYTRQDKDYIQRDADASAWSLNQIALPSGGTINVDYEADDYGYVQDLRAAQMADIVSFTSSDQFTPDFTENGVKLKKKNTRIWFKAEELDGETDPVKRKEIIEDYVEGLDDIYFKVFEELKKPIDLSESKAKDYVVGYAKVNRELTDYCGADASLGSYGYIDVKKEKYKTVGLDVLSTHPFRKAGWQYLRYARPDLFNDPGTYDEWTDAPVGSLLSISMLMVSTVKEALLLGAMGEYNKYSIQGYCRKMSLEKRSFIRLNSPKHKKYGGGHRVKLVQLSDNWTEGARNFGTEYSYETSDGKTSGVADYEPLVGGEENALKKPIWYNGNDQFLNFQHQDLFLETPFSEAVYPGARVVYSRVVVKNQGLSEDDAAEMSVDESQTGITVNEFYTAKDFPVKTRQTELLDVGGPRPIYIPWVGLTTINNRGYSQGYSVILNDMSGKPKSVSTYPYRNGIVEGIPISEVKFRYKTNSKGDLDNKVKVLDAHGDVRMAIMGVEQDFSIYEEQNSSFSEGIGVEVNADAAFDVSTGIPLLIPGLSALTARPVANYSEALYRGIVTSKVIHKSGILDEVESFSDGSTVVTKNMIYDAETGEALLTVVNNEWDKPIYNYRYAAHWAYDQMGGAYENYRAQFYFEGSAGSLSVTAGEAGTTVHAKESGLLVPGDEITIDIDADGYFETYYVSGYSPGGLNVDLQDSDGTSISIPSGAEGMIIRSGRRNLQSAKSGTIVALSDNFLLDASGLSKQFALWNLHITGADPQAGIEDATYYDLNHNEELSYDWQAEEHFMPNYYDCASGIYESIRVQCFDPNVIQFSRQCKGTLTFTGTTPASEGRIVSTTVDDGEGGTVVSWTEQFVDFKIINEEKIGDETISVEMLHIPSGDVYTANWDPGLGGHRCWENCGTADILHADAVTYTDDWGGSYPYEDVGDPVVDVVSGKAISSDMLNEYKYGKRGVWRAKKTYVYQINREQSGISPNGTRANIDGEYEPWEAFNWDDDHMNPKWDWTSEITRYSPFGFPIEERSRLNNVEDDLEFSDYESTAIYSSQMYGYENSVVTATSALSTYFEMGYNSFDESSADANEISNGHVVLLSDSEGIVVDHDKAHTGTNSLKVSDGGDFYFESQEFNMESEILTGLPNKKYVVSMWVNVEGAGSEGTISLLQDGVLKSVSTSDHNELIDGWKKLEISFVMPSSGSIRVNYNSTGITYVDDLRVGPYDGGMMTYVYNRNNLWLVATLDGLNYATFYNYDEEGNLVQVKKETENGIVTVQVARGNTSH